MVEAVAAKEQHKETVGTIVRVKTAKELRAAPKAEILEDLSSVAEWTAKLMEIDNRAYAESAASPGASLAGEGEWPNTNAMA